MLAGEVTDEGTELLQFRGQLEVRDLDVLAGGGRHHFGWE
jgi:hypothetical protein